MLRSMLVGVDGSAYSTAAVELGIRWAQRYDALLIGLGVIDAPTICKAQPVPLGATAYKAHRDASLLADASHKVTQFLEHCARRCAEADVACQILQEVGSPTERLLLEAQEADLLLLGQQTFFHFETQGKPDDTLHAVVKQSPCPVVAVPAALPEGQTVVVAYDGSSHATRALHMFQALGLASSYDVHVVCINDEPEQAADYADHAMAFLHGHDIVARAHVLTTSASPTQVLLEQVQQLKASLLVMGAYGRSTLRELLGASLTHTMLRESPVPLFLYH